MPRKLPFKSVDNAKLDVLQKIFLQITNYYRLRRRSPEFHGFNLKFDEFVKNPVELQNYPSGFFQTVKKELMLGFTWSLPDDAGTLINACDEPLCIN